MAIHNHGMNHLALVTSDIEATVQFWAGILGCKLRVLLHLPEEDPYADKTWDEPFGDLGDCKHYFFDIGNGDSIAFFDVGGQDGVPKTMKSQFAHHVALNVESEAQLLENKAHLEAHGIAVSEVIDHLFCKSIYFRSPEGHFLEYAWLTGPWTAKSPFIQDPKPGPAAMAEIGPDKYKANFRDYTAGVPETY